MYDEIKLNKEGLFGERYDRKHKDRIVEGIRAGKRKKGEFFYYNARAPLTIEGKVTLLDLIKIMAKMNSDELHALSTISDANLAPYLIDFCENPDPIPDTDDFGKLTAIQVYKILELSNWDSCDDVFDMQLHASAHGIGEIWSDSMKEVNEGRAKLEDVKDCNCYAIEFTPWQKMLDVPITIKEFVNYGEVIWKRTKPREFKIGVMGSKKKHSFGKIDREIVNRDEMRKGQKKIRTQVSLQEFFNGLFNELCFFGSPAKRKDEDDILRDRMKDVEKQIAKEKKKKK